MAGRSGYLGGNLSDDAYDGWHEFAKEHGVTVVALLEALGLRLGTYDETARLPEVLRQAVKDARGIAAERRGRGPARGP